MFFSIPTAAGSTAGVSTWALGQTTVSKASNPTASPPAADRLFNLLMFLLLVQSVGFNDRRSHGQARRQVA
jgi:hypothetical protein